MEASAAGLDYVERTAALTRTGRHGARSVTGRWADTQGITVARFLQHTSRENDPQIHVHQAVFSKVRTHDGRWLALDARTLKRDQRTLSALFHAAEGDYDLLIVSLSLENFDGLRLCSQARSLERTRQVPILAIADADNNARLLRGLEIGVNDYLLRPVDRNELLARARTQIRRRRYTDHLRDNVQNSIEMAITDALTGLHNRRYMESHLATLAEQASARGRPLALMILDIDHFKSINDTYGHDAGDDVLREFAVRIRKSIRGIDLACRYGGEEFVIVMPETNMHVAGIVAERLRKSIACEPFAIEKGARRIDVTISIGIATLDRKGEPISDVIKRADQALYRAKRDGRNRVVLDAA